MFMFFFVHVNICIQSLCKQTYFLLETCKGQKLVHTTYNSSTNMLVYVAYHKSYNMSP